MIVVISAMRLMFVGVTNRFINAVKLPQFYQYNMTETSIFIT